MASKIDPNQYISQLRDELLTLTKKSYGDYNKKVLPVIRQRLGPRKLIFEQELAIILPESTLREATQQAIRVAVGDLKPTPKKITAQATR